MKSTVVCWIIFAGHPRRNSRERRASVADCDSTHTATTRHTPKRYESGGSNDRPSSPDLLRPSVAWSPLLARHLRTYSAVIRFLLTATLPPPPSRQQLTPGRFVARQPFRRSHAIRPPS